MSKEAPPFLKVGTEWIELEIISESDVALTTFGYAPFLRVKEVPTDSEYGFYISAKSLAVPLEELRKDNGGAFEGIQFRVRKEGIAPQAPYEVDSNIGVQKRSQQPVNTSKGFHEKPRFSEDMKKKLENVLLD